MTTSSIDTMTNLIDAYVDHMKAGAYARTSIAKREEILRRIDRDLPYGLSAATVEELAGWLAHDEWKPATKSAMYWHIRGFFRYACDERNPQLDWDPSASLAKPRVPPGVPKPVTRDEVEHALIHAGEPWRLATRLAAYAGLRCCELATIRKEDVTPESIVVAGKGGKTRRIPTTPDVWAVVAASPRGRLIGRDARYLSSNARKHFERIGLDGVSLHRFRHWFATTLLANGVDLLTVSKLLGHANTATTAAYCQISDEQRQTAIRALPVLAPVSA